MWLTVALVAISAAWPRASAAADLIDRIVAVVNGFPITLSDVHAALRLGLVPREGAGRDLRGAIERVIERHLALIEVERYAPAEPAPESVDAALAAVRAKFPSEAEFAAALEESGFTPEELRRQLRDDLRRQRYEQQRFGFALHPSEEEILTYYRTNETRFTRGGALPPYDDVREEVRTALIEAKRSALVREWIAGLRRRADIVILPSVE